MGERWNGRGGAEQVRKAHNRGKPNNYNSGDGSGGMVVVVGTWGGAGTSPPKPIPGSKDS